MKNTILKFEPFECKVYKSEHGYIIRKVQKGQGENNFDTYFPRVQFVKGIDFDDDVSIIVNEGYLRFYKSKKYKIDLPYVFVKDFELI